MSLIVGVDIGGTYTDVLVVDPISNAVRTIKTPSTPSDQSLGLIQGLEEAAVRLDDVSLIVHGTTVATNALIEGKGARTALLATAGFKDVIELRNRHRPQMYGLTGSFTPLIPRNLRFDIVERVSAEGAVLIPLDENAVRTKAEQMRNEGVESVAVSFLHSYVNDAHERRAFEIISQAWPDVHVSLGSGLLAEVRELERTSTVAANAFLQPVMSNYLRSLVTRLEGGGFRGALLLIQSNGGVMGAAEAIEKPVSTVLSGPAAGVIGATGIAKRLGVAKLIAIDMGGTSLDVSVIIDGQPRVTAQREVRYGVPIRGEMIDIQTVGAGGGSIAWLDNRGILNIGPESAGAEPGPACYGRGGDRPTLTDANVVLGRIDPGSAIGRTSGLALNRDLAEKAIDRHVAGALGLSVEDAAEVILTVAVNKIAGHLRKATISEGLDPREMSLVAFGGAGPLHASALLKELSFSSVIIPAHPGVLSAQGCALADFRHDMVQTVSRPLTEVTSEELSDIRNRHVESAMNLLRREGADEEQVIVEVKADLYYRGQTHPLLVSLKDLMASAIASRFEELYVAKFGRLLDAEIELLNLRTAVRVERPPVSVDHGFLSEGSGEPGHRPIRFAGELLECDVFQRSSLVPGQRLSRPAIIEQPDTTTTVEPGVVVTVDENNILILTEE